MSTAAAQRRLLEAIGELGNTPDLDIGLMPDPLMALATGVQTAVDVAEIGGQPGVARIYACLGSLVLAVREDQQPKENAHG